VFSPEYKLAIVAEYENAPNGEKGAILHREGLYSSHAIEWTRARDAGPLERVADSRRSPKRPKRSVEAAELERLRVRNAKLEAELTTTRIALDIIWTSWGKHTRSGAAVRERGRPGTAKTAEEIVIVAFNELRGGPMCRSHEGGRSAESGWAIRSKLP